MDIVVWGICLIAVAGSGYALLTVVAIGFLPRRRSLDGHDRPAVTILKPLHGAEPRLAENLTSFIRQDYRGPVRIIFGVAGADDPAIGIVERLMAGHPGADLHLVVDPAQHGRNRKISNLLNMDKTAHGEIVVLADSDIGVRPDYLDRLVSALEQPGVGAVSCLYRGAPAPGLWSRLSALGIDAAFLPNAVVGIVLGLAKPCFGSTIALRRTTLERIGGFDALRDQLADDFQLGAAVRSAGLKVVFPDVIVDHICVQDSLAGLWRHQLRWARTIRFIDPLGHAGSVVTHPVPVALIGVLASGLSPWALLTLVLAILCRGFAWRRLQASFALAPAPLWMVMLHDLVSFCVFVWSFAGRSVDWQGHRYDISSRGIMMPSSGDDAGRLPPASNSEG